MNDELMLERFTLMKDRIQEIQGEELVKAPYRDFFKKTAAFLIRPFIRIFCLSSMKILMEIQRMRNRCWERNLGSF